MKFIFAIGVIVHVVLILNHIYFKVYEKIPLNVLGVVFAIFAYFGYEKAKKMSGKN